jgi:hypothetical protein
MALSGSSEGTVRHAALAGADLSAKQGYLCKLSSGALALAGNGERGFPLVDKPADGQVGTIVLSGKAKVLVGTGGVTEMGSVAAEAGGTVVAAATGDVVCGTALETAAAGAYAMILVAQAGGIVA